MRRSNNKAIEITKHINAFLDDYVPNYSGRSENTRKSYDIAISLYIDYLEKAKNIVPERLGYECFSRDNIEGWLRWLFESRKCSPQTCNVRLASLRVFLEYLGDKDVSLLYLYESATRVKRLKEASRKVTGMSKDAVRALMNAPDTKTSVGRRDIAMIVTLYGTAVRMDELLSMKIGQLHLEAKKPYAVVIGKNDNIRTLYLLPKAVAHLRQYIKEYHSENPNPEAYVFYSRVSGKNTMMSQMAVSKRLKLYAKTANKVCSEVPLDLHAHQLRHAKASHWLEDGINIVQISRLLGHLQLETTMIYLDVSLEQKADALTTLEEEDTRSLPKKWKGSGTSLASFCGVRPIVSN
ncbi:MAG: site-specific integrase [Oscillospiraceae bacterium]|nr:site-specific integrase [Oscillospiraceae bacterium]